MRAQPTTRPPVLEWVVTAPYQRSRSLPRATPWGTVHLKRVGGRVTACGLPTVGWHAFWELTFSPFNDHACRTCARVTQLAPPG